MMNGFNIWNAINLILLIYRGEDPLIFGMKITKQGMDKTKYLFNHKLQYAL